MSNYRLVWSDKDGDQRKNKTDKTIDEKIVINNLQIQLRRLTSGKGRTVIEMKGLPNNKKWCNDLAKEIKKSLGVGGTYKNNAIEIHGEKLQDVINFLDKKNLKWKKTGG